jgi:hypothetical protein
LQPFVDFDEAYFQTVIGACFQAIARTTLDGESERVRPTEISAALAHVMGMIAATTDAVPDPRALAQEIAAEFLDSFQAARETISGASSVRAAV